MKLTFYTAFVLGSCFTVIFPIIIGFLNYKILNKSLKIFLGWLIYYLIFISLLTYMAFNDMNNLFMKYLNNPISFFFLYLIFKDHWKSRKTNLYILILAFVILIFSMLDYLLISDTKTWENYSTPFQTFSWLFISFYYLLNLINNNKDFSLPRYPFFWIAISFFISTTLSLGYDILNYSAIQFSHDFFEIIENISYSSYYLMNFLFAIALFKVKNGIREIIKV